MPHNATLWAVAATLRWKQASSSMDVDGDGPLPGAPDHGAAVADKSGRLWNLITASLLVHKAVAPPPAELTAPDEWLHRKKTKLIEGYCKVSKNDPRHCVMYRNPMQALILFSKLCINWWVGPAAICIFELLAERFDGVRAYALRDRAEYEAGVRDMANGVMYAHRCGASLWPHALDSAKKKVRKLMTTTLQGLRTQGAPPIAPLPARALPCPAPARECPTAPYARPAQAASTTRSTRTSSASWPSRAWSPRSTRSSWRSAASRAPRLSSGTHRRRSRAWPLAPSHACAHGRRFLHGQNRPQWDYAKIDFATRDEPADTRNALDRVKQCSRADLEKVHYLFGTGYAHRGRPPVPATHRHPATHSADDPPPPRVWSRMAPRLDNRKSAMAYANYRPYYQKSVKAAPQEPAASKAGVGSSNDADADMDADMDDAIEEGVFEEGVGVERRRGGGRHAPRLAGVPRRL